MFNLLYFLLSILILLFILLSSFFISAEPSLKELSNSSIWKKIEVDDIEYYTKIDSGRVPILCFHKIGTESRYEITSKNFEDLLIYLNNLA